MTDNWMNELFGAPLTEAERAEQQAAADARDTAKLAAMGLTRGQRVQWDGAEWTVVCAMSAAEPAVMLHTDAPGRVGFAAEGAPIPVSELGHV